MKLYYLPFASSLFPHIVLVEAGLTVDAIKVDEHTKVIDGGGDYRSVNLDVRTARRLTQTG
jgi:glutathione S-transferase